MHPRHREQSEIIAQAPRKRIGRVIYPDLSFFGTSLFPWNGGSALSPPVPMPPHPHALGACFAFLLTSHTTSQSSSAGGPKIGTSTTNTQISASTITR